MKFRRMVVSTSGALRHQRSSDAINAHAAPAAMEAASAATTPNRAATNAASAPAMNCPSPPMFQTPARKATAMVRPVRRSGMALRMLSSRRPPRRIVSRSLAEWPKSAPANATSASATTIAARARSAAVTSHP